jgi:hypothetical protein
MFTSGKVSYEVGDHLNVTPYGGVAVMHRLVTKLGLVAAIDDELELLKVHLPYHESDHVLNLAYNVITGGRRLEDIDRLRHDVAYMNGLGAELIPDPTTAGDFLRRFDGDDVTTLMDVINSVRPNLWRSRGKDLLGPVTYIDVDGSVAPTDGERKQGMDISFKGIWGYHPLVVSVANTGEVLFVVNRPGNAPSHQDAATWIDKAIDLVAPYTPRVCLRGDTDFSLTEHLDRWAQRADFVLGMDCSPTLRGIAEALPEQQWVRLTRPAPYQTTTGTTRSRRANIKNQIVAERGYTNLELNHEDVTVFTYRPRKCKRDYQVVALRKNITRSQGGLALIDEIRYFFYITTYTDKTPAQIVELANDRCDQENINAQLKSGINALHAPVNDLISNWAYMVIATLAWNIKAWYAMTMHLKQDRHDYLRMKFRRFFHSVILIPAVVILTARTVTVRLVGYTPALGRFLSARNTIERLQVT